MTIGSTPYPAHAGFTAAASSGADGSTESTKKDEYFVFFGNQALYTFIRLFHTLYHRLATLKRQAAKLASSASDDRLSPFAVSIGLANPMPDIDNVPAPRGKTYYDHMLTLCERLFEGEVDNATFEENLRYMWGINAYPAFTFDKIIATMVKHVSTAGVRCGVWH